MRTMLIPGVLTLITGWTAGAYADLAIGFNNRAAPPSAVYYGVDHDGPEGELRVVHTAAFSWGALFEGNDLRVGLASGAGVVYRPTPGLVPGPCTYTVDAGGVITIVQPAAAGAWRGDWNADGRRDLTDIFDFLGAWFAGDQAADIDASGVVAVQDIFDFLAAWFGG